MLKSAVMGDKVETCPSSGGGDLEFLTQAYKLTYLDLKNVTRCPRPLFGCQAQYGTLIARNLSYIDSYGLQGAKYWKVHVDKLTSLNQTATNGSQYMELIWSNRDVAYILSLKNVLKNVLYSKETLKFTGTDGYVHWDSNATAYIACYEF